MTLNKNYIYIFEERIFVCIKKNLKKYDFEERIFE